MSSKNHNIYTNPLLRRKMVVIKHTTANNSKPTTSKSASSNGNNIETFILGTTATKTKNNQQEEINMYKKLEMRRQQDNIQFKDKSKYLQNIPYKAIHDKSAFEKKLILNKILFYAMFLIQDEIKHKLKNKLQKQLMKENNLILNKKINFLKIKNFIINKNLMMN